MITSLAASHWREAAWTFLVNHLGSIASFLGGAIAQGAKKWYQDRRENRTKFRTQVNIMKGSCRAVAKSRVRLAAILTEYANSTNSDIRRLSNEYQQVAAEVLQQLELVKAAFPDKTVIDAVRKDAGLQEYNQLWKAVQDIAAFAKLSFTEVAVLSPGEREQKLVLLDAIKDPFS